MVGSRTVSGSRTTDGRSYPARGRPLLSPWPRTQPRGAAVARHRCPACVGGARGTLREAVRTAVDREHAPRGVRLPVTRFVGHLDLWAGVPEERVAGAVQAIEIRRVFERVFGSRTARRTSDESAEDGQEVEPRADAPVTLEPCAALGPEEPPETVERGRARWGAAPARWPRRPSKHRVARGRGPRARTPFR